MSRVNTGEPSGATLTWVPSFASTTRRRSFKLAMIATRWSANRRRCSFGSTPPVVKTSSLPSGVTTQLTKSPARRSLHFWLLKSKIYEFKTVFCSGYEHVLRDPFSSVHALRERHIGCFT